ncbi:MULTISPECIES: GntR family transcriptional regulator [unclassified Brenneria]|uniref:GntR family transcriptional regulator n=1 Tax=unclassified Brenneria TaxID=2634434 RepID=UPI0029C10F37|nr:MULTISPECIES: GntR family transcriptional regulator [unclassified Brenneria]MDX5631022.1 GntR family transcriptional regulator [Brenneria sp. L3-3Z]MDX5698103.1 GntR family transcriptional regulator [Brenneria sp. L4-2C]MEE3663619.1 GntR family transcriptional regulator [Brenneria sp. g21c3]
MRKLNYIQLVRQLTNGITQGLFPLGSLLPTELQLCELYGTSRHTVRAALNELQLLGLVTRRKNVGTRVTATQVRNDFQPTPASLDDLVQFGKEHIRVVQNVGPVQVTGSLAKTLACTPDTLWLRISSLYLQEGERMPLGWTDIYIEPDYAEIIADVHRQPNTLICSMIENRFGRRVAGIRQEICACTITDGAMAKALRMKTGAAALKVVRHYLDATGRPFEITVTVHPETRFSVVLQLNRATSTPGGAQEEGE